MSSQRNEVQRLIAKYKADIVELEEREEDVMRRIQILENLIPTVLVWFMWKESRSRRPVPSPQDNAEEEAQRKLMHLNTILEQLQESDNILKEEENVLRRRIEDLENSLQDVESREKHPMISGSEERATLGTQELESEMVARSLKIQSLEEEQAKFKELLEDPETDWKKKYEELMNEAGDLSKTLEETNEKLKQSAENIKQLQEDHDKKDKDIQEKIRELEEDTEALFKDALDENDLYEIRDEERQVFSAVQGAIEEVQSIRDSLSKGVGTLEEENSFLKDRLKKKNETIIGLKQDIRDLKKELNRVSVAITPEEVEVLAVLERNLQEKEEHILLLKQESEVLSDKLLEAQSQLRKSQIQIRNPEPQQGVPIDTIIERDEEEQAEVDLAKEGSPVTFETPVDIPVDSLVLAPEEVIKTDSRVTSPRPSIPPPLIFQPLDIGPVLPSIQSVDYETFEEVTKTFKEPTPTLRVSETPTIESIADLEVSVVTPQEHPSPTKAPEIPPVEYTSIITPEDLAVHFEERTSPSKVSETPPVVPDAIQREVPATSTTVSEITPVEPTAAPEISGVPPEVPTSPRVSETHSVVPITAPEVSEVRPEVPAPSTRVSETSPDASIVESEVPILPASSARISGTPPDKPIAAPEVSEVPPEVPTPSSRVSETISVALEAQLKVSEVPPKVPSPSSRVSDIASILPIVTPEDSTAQSEVPASSSRVSDIAPIVPIQIVTAQSEVPASFSRVSEPPPVESTVGPEVSEVPLEVPAFSSKVSETAPVITPEDSIVQRKEPPPARMSETPPKTAPGGSTVPLEEPALSSSVSKTSPLDSTAARDVLKDTEGAASSPYATSEKVTMSTPSFTQREAADVTEAHAITSEPFEVPYTADAMLPSTPSGLALQKDPATLRGRPSVDSLTAQTLQSKCRVKDHLIKSMADQLRELAKNNVWSGNKLLESTVADPVKTYDFDRTTLFKYLKGEEPKDFVSVMKSNDAYSTSNPLNVKALRKLDKDSLLIEWAPPPSTEVVGFQIFVNGEFMYWVHSAKRNIALLHPLDLKLSLDITVSPVNENGEVVHRSVMTYTP